MSRPQVRFNQRHALRQERAQKSVLGHAKDLPGGFELGEGRRVDLEGDEGDGPVAVHGAMCRGREPDKDAGLDRGDVATLGDGRRGAPESALGLMHACGQPQLHDDAEAAVALNPVPDSVRDPRPIVRAGVRDLGRDRKEEGAESREPEGKKTGDDPASASHAPPRCSKGDRTSDWAE